MSKARNIAPLLFILISAYSEINGQEVKLPPKFFTLHNARISMGLGFEIGWAESNKGLLYHYTGTPKELNSVIDSGGYGDFNIAFDLYAPNSFLGFCIEADYGSWNLNLRKDTNSEFFVVRTLELPFYFKLRPGNIASNSHLWLMLGASYIIPLGVDRAYNTEREDHNKSQLSGVKALTGMVGYEQYFGERNASKAIDPKGTWDRMRFVIFGRFSYILDSRLNYDYYQSPSNKSILKDFNRFKYKDYVITFGIKYFFRLGKFNRGGI